MLLPDRALYRPSAKMLVVADPHFGKGQLFRERGIPVPKGTTADDLHRLSCLIDRLRPDALLFLGDLFHGRVDTPGPLVRRIDRWRGRHAALRILLATGNHDRGTGGLAAAFRLDGTAEAHADGPFSFTHQPAPDPPGYNIAGHLHPAVVLKGKGRLRETLACFRIGPRSALLPAFGVFTGTQIIPPRRGDRIFVIAGDEVLAVPPVNK